VTVQGVCYICGAVAQNLLRLEAGKLNTVFIFPLDTSIITIESTYKATCFGLIGPSSGLTTRTGLFTSSTFWDPKLFTKVV